MNQTRTFLLIAWLAVTFLLFQQWQTPVPTPPAPTVNDSAALAPAPAAVGALPALPAGPAPVAAAASTAQAVEIITDVYRLTVDLKGVSILRAELLTYPKEKKAGSANVMLLDNGNADFFIAESGWLTRTHASEPNHNALFTTADGKRRYEMSAGQDSLSVPFVWTDASGISLTKTLVLQRGKFEIGLQQTLRNAGTAPWSGFAYEQLKRIPPPPPPKHAGFTNPESFSFIGSAWYGEPDKYEKISFADYYDNGAIQSPNKPITDGWFGMLQHHFVSVWLPAKGDTQTYSLATEGPLSQAYYLVRGISGETVIAPGASHSREDRLWVGPKAQKAMNAVHPTLDLSVDYGIFSFLAQPLFWLLSKLHDLLGNWGWAIIAIVIVLKALLFPLSAKQYQSMARMRAIQPRIEALKERYGDDRQKFAVAQMELYKKEKINPAAGCLPMLIPIPIFLALYWVLVESVELRQAPWIGWIRDLSLPDPSSILNLFGLLPFAPPDQTSIFFILSLGVLPIILGISMWLQQTLNPAPTDPAQKMIFAWMPWVFMFMLGSFASGLVLYWITNNTITFIQQYAIMRSHGHNPDVFGNIRSKFSRTKAVEAANSTSKPSKK